MEKKTKIAVAIVAVVVAIITLAMWLFMKKPESSGCVLTVEIKTGQGAPVYGAAVVIAGQYLNTGSTGKCTFPPLMYSDYQLLVMAWEWSNESTISLNSPTKTITKIYQT